MWYYKDNLLFVKMNVKICSRNVQPLLGFVSQKFSKEPLEHSKGPLGVPELQFENSCPRPYRPLIWPHAYFTLAERLKNCNGCLHSCRSLLLRMMIFLFQGWFIKWGLFSKKFFELSNLFHPLKTVLPCIPLLMDKWWCWVMAGGRWIRNYLLIFSSQQQHVYSQPRISKQPNFINPFF